MRTGIYLATLLGAATVLVGGEREARACGGCFHPPPNPTETPTDVTDHRMILTISPAQTTLYDQIEYSGSPSSFAWVLPIASAGSVTIGLSADVVFGTLDALTQTTIVGPPKNCPPPPVCNQNAGAAAPSFGNGGGGGSGGGGASDGVTVVKQQTVGPYATVQLHSTDPTALNSWLTSNGFDVQTDEQAIVTQYVNEHFDFLAMKLVPGANVTSMRPVRVTTPGASPVLPLRMVAAGTGATVGVTLWVLADGRYEPQNFPFFHIEDSDLAWDWNANASNYTTLRQQDEASLGGRGWEIESSIDLSSVTIQNGILSGGVLNQGGFGGASSAPAENDYLAVAATSSTPGETADQVRQDDMTALFSGIGATTGSVRITRVRSDVAHTALTQDLALQASQDQSPLSNQRTVTKELNEPLCPVYDGNCNQVGEAPRSQVQNASQQSFDCSTTQEPAAGWGLLAGLGGIAGLVVIRSRQNRRRAG